MKGCKAFCNSLKNGWQNWGREASQGTLIIIHSDNYQAEKNDARDLKLADGARFKECEKRSHMKSKFRVTRIREWISLPPYRMAERISGKGRQ